MIVIDTNVLSELMRPLPDPGVLAWMSTIGPGQAATTSITIGEIGLGLRRLPRGKRHARLEAAFESLLGELDREILAFDRAAAEHYARISQQRETEGKRIDPLDCMIAAICASRGASLATRNQRDFDGTGLEIINPWGPSADARAPRGSDSPSE
jgi:predicted nucleic acid-binding protein